MYLQLTDEAIMDRIKKNDQLALQTLFNKYYKPLCQLCAVYTRDYAVAEEIIANLFIKLWDNRNDAAILNIKSYLFVSAKNLSLNYTQKKKEPVDSMEDIDFQQHVFPDQNTPYNILSGRESYNKILKTIDTLPPSQREVLLMSHVDNINKHEISKVLGISVRTVETTLYQSIKKLRVLLKDSRNLTSGN